MALALYRFLEISHLGASPKNINTFVFNFFNIPSCDCIF